MNMLAFTHSNGSPSFTKGTICINLCTKEDLKMMLNMEATAMLFSVGVSVCSSRDQFNKKTGRDISSNRMNNVVCYYLGSNLRATACGYKTVFHFMSEIPVAEQSVKIEFGVSTIPSSDEVKLVYAIFKEA